MPIVCFNRPNRTRKRTFTARDVGRIACQAVKAGVPPSEIVKELEECLGEQLCDKERVRQQLRSYLQSTAAFFDLLSVLAGIVIGLLIPVARWGVKILRLGFQRVIRLLPRKVRLELEDLAEREIQRIEKRTDDIIGEFKVLQESLESIIKNI